MQGDERGPADEGSQTEASRRSFLAILRHELRTPLNAIIGYSEMLMEDAGDRGLKGFIPDLGKIRAAGRQLLVIVNEILNPMKIGPSSAEPDRDDFGARLRIELQTPLDSIIDSSGMLLKQADDMGQSDFVLDIRKIRTAADSFLKLIDDIDSVPMTGPVMTGLRSTTASAQISSAMRSLHAREEPAGAIANRGSVLVIDDNEMNQDLMKRYLNRQGHSVMVAEGGRQALELMKSGAFDLVLLDVMMPDMDGYEVLREIKRHEEWRHLPVIMISALDEMDSVVRCIEIGAEDYLPKPFDPVLLKARTDACLEKKRLRDIEVEHQRLLAELNSALEIRNRFLQKIFGRYLSEEVVHSILETPDGLKIGGEKRDVTIMMADLRGFTSISEETSPESVVDILTVFLETMTDIILKYQGTINEFIGDAILVIFGAPLPREDHAVRAVACAIEMQLAMDEVNQRIANAGNPPIAMGIGINTGSAVVGNIGSSKRAAYTVIGRNVNLASRIESCTAGGQIFISGSTREACGERLKIVDRMEIVAKGVKDPIAIYEVGGIYGDHNLVLPEKEDAVLPRLENPLNIKFTVLVGKHVSAEAFAGTLVGLLGNSALVEVDTVPERFAEIKICLFNCTGDEVTDDLYAKIASISPGSPVTFRINFTSVSSEARSFFEVLNKP